MTINYLKNKKYHILVSLLCYALGAQKVAATKGKKHKLYNWNNGDPTYEIENFQQIKKLYEEASHNIAVFAGKYQDDMYEESVQEYIFIMDDPSFFTGDDNKEKPSEITVTGFPANIYMEDDDKHIKASLAAYSKGWFGEEAFIFRIQNYSCNFYYRKGWSGGELIEVMAWGNNFYQSYSYNEEDIHQVWEVDHNKKKIVATWEVHADYTSYIREPSKQGWLYHTLELGSSGDWPYIQLTYGGIIGSCMAVMLTIVYATFHKAIHKKVMQLVHRYVLSKKKKM